MIIENSLKLVIVSMLFMLLYGCSTHNFVPKKNFVFSAEQAEANRALSRKIDRDDYQEANSRKDDEVRRNVNARIRLLEAEAKVERAKPDTVIIDRSRSVF